MVARPTRSTKEGRDRIDAEVIRLLRERGGCVAFVSFVGRLRSQGLITDERQVDRAVQRLRKAGKIVFVGARQGWRLP